VWCLAARGESGKTMVEIGIEDLWACPEFLFQWLGFLLLNQGGNGALRIVQVSENQGVCRASFNTVRLLPFPNPVHAEITTFRNFSFLPHVPLAVRACEGTEFASDTFFQVYGDDAMFIDETGIITAH